MGIFGIFRAPKKSGGGQGLGVDFGRLVYGHPRWVYPFWVQRQLAGDNSAITPQGEFKNHAERQATYLANPHSREGIWVDPHGLVLPLDQAFGIDLWLYDNGTTYFPSQAVSGVSQCRADEARSLLTRFNPFELEVTQRWSVAVKDGSAIATGLITVKNLSVFEREVSLALALRPFNLEGAGSVTHLSYDPRAAVLTVDGQPRLKFFDEADEWQLSSASEGDLAPRFGKGWAGLNQVHCPQGLGMAAFAFKKTLPAGEAKHLYVQLALEKNPARHGTVPWLSVDKFFVFENEKMTGLTLHVPDAATNALFDASKTDALIIFRQMQLEQFKTATPDDLTALLRGLLTLGCVPEAQACLEQLWKQAADSTQKSVSAHGQAWGQAFGLTRRYVEWFKSVEALDPWLLAMQRVGEALLENLARNHRDKEKTPPQMLAILWQQAGLSAMADLLRKIGDVESFKRYRSILARHGISPQKLKQKFPDPNEQSGRVSFEPWWVDLCAAVWPLHLVKDDLAGWQRWLGAYHDTWIRNGLVFDPRQDGLLPEKSVSLAQALRHCGDPRAAAIFEQLTATAGAACRWPDVLHPGSGGGSGHLAHDWRVQLAYVELLRYFLVDDSAAPDELTLFAGIPTSWWQSAGGFKFLQMPTAFGTLGLKVEYARDQVALVLNPQFKILPERIRVFLPAEVRATSAGRPMGRQLWLPPDAVHAEFRLTHSVFTPA